MVYGKDRQATSSGDDHYHLAKSHVHQGVQSGSFTFQQSPTTVKGRQISEVDLHNII